MQLGNVIQKIGIVGLGLVGASFAKSIHKADAILYGYDVHKPMLRFALDECVIDEIITSEKMGEIAILFLAIFRIGFYFICTKIRVF